MRVICSYCRTLQPDKEPVEVLDVTHGICPACYAHYSEQLRGVSTLEYLARYDVPVLLVDHEGRVLGANDAALQTTGKSEHCLGLLTGEFVECMHARRPEGCGHSEHCAACTIRHTLTAARAGVPQRDVMVHVDDGTQRTHFRISAEFVRGVVRLTLEEVVRVETRPESADYC